MSNAPETNEDDYLRVSGGSNPQSVASAIAHALYEHKQVKLRAIGASSVNQMVKSIAIARGYVAPRGLDLTCKPGFTTVQSRDGDISALVMHVFAN